MSKPYFATHAAVTLAATGGTGAATIKIPASATRFVCQAINAQGDPASGTNRQHFTIKLRDNQNGEWCNQAVRADQLAGTGENPGLLINEVEIPAGQQVEVDYVNENGAVVYSNVRTTLVGRLE